MKENDAVMDPSTQPALAPDRTTPPPEVVVEGGESLAEMDPLEIARVGAGKTLLQVRGLKKHFPITGGLLKRQIGTVYAVDGVDFDVNAGETFSLVGESGCGKTTLGRSVLRLIEPTAGSITFAGRDISRISHDELRPLRRKMQIVFQDPFGSLNPRMPVSDIIGEGLLAQGMKDRKARDRKVEDSLELVGLRREYTRRYPHEFSGGQRQRIGIARALALGPDLVVCDEPVSALDVSIQSQVLNLLLDLRRELNLTYIFISHNLSVVQYFSDRVGVMYLGKIAELGSVEQLYKNPRHPYTVALLSAIPDPNPIAAGGMEKLRAAGIDVVVGVETDRAMELNAPFLNRFTSRRPWVTLKLATTIDGAIADSTGHSNWITGEESRREVHRMRAGNDAIAVGMRTLITDDPRLSARTTPEPRRQPARIIFGRGKAMPLTSRIVEGAHEHRTYLVTHEEDADTLTALRRAGVEVIEARDLNESLVQIKSRGIDSLLVEGGAGLAAEFIERGCVDRLVIFQAPLLLGQGSLSAFSGLSERKLMQALRLEVLRRQEFGQDQMTVYAFPTG